MTWRCMKRIGEFVACFTPTSAVGEEMGAVSLADLGRVWGKIKGIPVMRFCHKGVVMQGKVFNLDEPARFSCLIFGFLSNYKRMVACFC